MIGAPRRRSGEVLIDSTDACSFFGKIVETVSYCARSLMSGTLWFHQETKLSKLETTGVAPALPDSAGNAFVRFCIDPRQEKSTGRPESDCRPDSAIR